MAQSLGIRISRYFLTIFLIVVVIHFWKSGFYKSTRTDHDLALAKRATDKFMVFVAKEELDKAYNLFYSPAKQLGKREEFKESYVSSLEDLGRIREIVYLANYPQPKGPYLGMYYRVRHEKARSVDYYFLLLKENLSYSVFELVYGESGTFYPEFSFKRENKVKPTIIFEQ